jgi:hypothetical protein
MNVGWLIPAIILLFVGFVCMFSTAIEFALGKLEIGNAAGAFVFHATVGFFGIWMLAIAA